MWGGRKIRIDGGRRGRIAKGDREVNPAFPPPPDHRVILSNITSFFDISSLFELIASTCGPINLYEFNPGFITDGITFGFLSFADKEGMRKALSVRDILYKGDTMTFLPSTTKGSNNLLVKNLSFKVSEVDLVSYLSTLAIYPLAVIYDEKCARMSFIDEFQGCRAHDILNGHEIDGRKLKVEFISDLHSPVSTSNARVTKLEEYLLMEEGAELYNRILTYKKDAEALQSTGARVKDLYINDMTSLQRKFAHVIAEQLRLNHFFADTRSLVISIYGARNKDTKDSVSPNSSPRLTGATGPADAAAARRKSSSTKINSAGQVVKVLALGPDGKGPPCSLLRLHTDLAM
jgi:hypothetical protein